MQIQRKTLTQLSIPICFETLFYMLSGMVDTLMLSSVSDQAVGAVGTANTYISVFIIMFGVISSGKTTKAFVVIQAILCVKTPLLIVFYQ